MRFSFRIPHRDPTPVDYSPTYTYHTLPVRRVSRGGVFPWRQALRLSKQTEYGLRAVVQLARLYPRTFVQSRDLAQQEHLPTKFLEAILLTLRRGGFLESKVGREGGYRLSRPPKEIRVGEVVRRLEGRLSDKEGKL